ncbi:MAG: choice-of-anchor B family protein [Bacteroidetes bacterium]|nr:choice-of-anchor B family protein [Bacteroidota bacterium]
MKKYFLLLGLLASTFSQGQFYTGYNMVQLSRWSNDNLPSLGTQKFNNGWGWYDSAKQKEYAIFGSLDSTYFFDVTDPFNIILCDAEAGRATGSIWRNYKTYQHYCYAVADHGRSSLQIFDMQYLPDSVHKVYDSDSLIMRSHTSYIDGNRLYCNSVVNGINVSSAVTVLGLDDPENPQFLGTLRPPIFDGVPAFVKCHDSYVRNDTLYCSGENAGVFIYDMKDPNNGNLLGTISDYPDKGYNHSSYLSDDGKVLVFADENADLGLKAYDVTNPANPKFLSLFKSHANATPHNPYFIGRRLFVSYYHDGIYVWNLNDPKNPEVIAWYDTYPQNGTDYAGYEGCWGVYPYLPSGNILAFDMTNGMFVLRMDKEASSQNPNYVSHDIRIYPNPSKGIVNIDWVQGIEETQDLQVLDLQGKVVFQQNFQAIAGQNELQIHLQGMEKGIYVVQLTGAKTHICKKLTLQ